MKCIRCGSERTIKFIDGFGRQRIFCKGCKGSFEEILIDQLNFKLIYDNPRALVL